MIFIIMYDALNERDCISYRPLHHTYLVTDRHSTVRSETGTAETDRFQHSFGLMAQVVAAVLTGLLVYIGVMFRRRILPKAFNIEDVEVSESLFTPRQQRVEGGDGDSSQTLDIDCSNPGLRQRFRGGQRERSLSDPK